MMKYRRQAILLEATEVVRVEMAGTVVVVVVGDTETSEIESATNESVKVVRMWICKTVLMWS